ncbi:GMC oxidoreductase [Spirochaetota bacterium]
MKYDYDYIVVGSGFGGSVSAMRLAQKGYSVCIIEAGKRYLAEDFPDTNWNVRKSIWLPRFALYGTWRLKLFKSVLVLAGAGVGGGSLNYANTHYVPGDQFFKNDIIKKMGGKKALFPFYNLAKKMFGVVKNPVNTEADKKIRKTASAMGFGKTFDFTPVAVYFGSEGETKEDPYFMGEGFDRSGCTLCGGCMVGCKHNAKNTLDKNYLYFAEKFGAKVVPDNKVIDVKPLSGDGTRGYEITSARMTGLRSPRTTFTSMGIVFSGGVLGTLELLLKLKAKKRLPEISHQLGKMVRTNSESLIGVTASKKDIDYSHGVSITSSVFPDDVTHIEPVRFSQGSDLLGLITAVLTDGGGKIPRQLRYLMNCLKHPFQVIRNILPFGFARKSVILLVMQTVDNFLHLKLKRHIYWPFKKTLSSEQDKKKNIPSYIPVANEFARKLAGIMKGQARSTINEVMLNAPVTAHILGGCSIAETSDGGVIDYEHRVFGYKNMYICDGSTVPANLGVNPALSITAITERAMSFIPVKKSKKLRCLQVEKKWKVEKLLTSKKKK